MDTRKVLKYLHHQVVRQSDSDQVTVIGAGVTLHEALAAADILANEGKHVPPSSGCMWERHMTFHAHLDYHVIILGLTLDFLGTV